MWKFNFRGCWKLLIVAFKRYHHSAYFWVMLSGICEEDWENLSQREDKTLYKLWILLFLYLSSSQFSSIYLSLSFCICSLFERKIFIAFSLGFLKEFMCDPFCFFFQALGACSTNSKELRNISKRIFCEKFQMRRINYKRAKKLD